MTTDQLALLHRIMQMSQDEFAQLRANYLTYRNAVNLLDAVVGRPNDAEVLARMIDHHEVIARA